MSFSFSDKLINLRRNLHCHPETGWTEYYTTALIIETLQAENVFVRYGTSLHDPTAMYGMPARETSETAWKRAAALGAAHQILLEIKDGFTGCIAEIHGAFPGKTTVFRVDIDACDLEECHEDSHYPAALGFDSVHDGLMHACGHDAHIAIGVGAAILIHQNREHLHGSVRIIFQPAEEGLRGAASMVKAGVLQGSDRLIGLHVGLHDLPIGTVATSCTDFLSGTKMDVHFHGKAAHAGLCPELGRNALAAAAKTTLDLLDIPTRFEGINRVNVGTFHAGSGRNIIPANAHLAIETRSDHADRNKTIRSLAMETCQRAAEAYGCTVDVQYMGGSDAAACNEELAAKIHAALKNVPSVKNILPSISFGGGEDVTTMMQYVQEHGGTATELLLGMPLVAPHHNECFDIDEAVIPLGAEILYRIAFSFQ